MAHVLKIARRKMLTRVCMILDAFAAGVIAAIALKRRGMSKMCAGSGMLRCLGLLVALNSKSIT